MRVRSLLAAFGAATLLVGLTTAPATAGTGVSTWCNDGVGYREFPILTSPVTVGIEVASAPGSANQLVVVCYSTSAPGQPANVTSGAILLHTVSNTGTVEPGAYVGIACLPDHVTGIGPACGFANSANMTPGDVGVSQQPAACLVMVGSTCAAFVPGIRINTDQDPNRALLSIQVLSVPVVVNAQCIPVVGLCP